MKERSWRVSVNAKLLTSANSSLFPQDAVILKRLDNNKKTPGTPFSLDSRREPNL